MKQKEKTGTVATVTSFKPKIYINAGANNKCFSISDSTENTKKIQCQKCNPPLNKPPGATELCANCEAEEKQTAQTFFNNFKKHRTIKKIDCRCDHCNKPKAATMMSKRLPICRICENDLKSKGATAQNLFIARTLNNIHRKLKEAIV